MKTIIAGLLGSVALVAMSAPQAASAANYALISDGASFVSGSSVIAQGTFGLTMFYGAMQNNLLSNVHAAAISNGDTRYLFSHNDPNGTVEINLGQVRQLTSIGANIDLPGMDRPVLGPFSVSVSTDGSLFTAWGGSVVIDGSTLNPVGIAGGPQGVQYIRYSFGNTGDPYGGNGGAGISQLFANGPGVPEPATWALMIGGFGLAGVALRRRSLAAA